MADNSTNSVSAREFGEFVIDSLTPETVPMGRLAEYMSTLADLLGSVQADLERDPPNVENALARVRHLLDGERPAA